MPSRKPPQYIMGVLARASQEHGIPFNVLRSFAEIESSFNPKKRTGKLYNGLFMLSHSEFKRGGGKGNILDAEANTNAFANILKKNMSAFEKQMGRPPSAWETYLVHQQGVAGGPAHLKNPDKLAWVNMYNTPEGQRKGKGWAKKAIKGNIPVKTFRKQFGGDVNRVTSGEFAKLWQARYARASGGTATEAAFDGSAAGMPLPGRGEMANLPERGMRTPAGSTDMDVPPQRSAALGTEVPRKEYRDRAKFQYRAPEYESANDIGAGGPPVPERNPQDAPEPSRSALIPGTPEAARTGSRMAESTRFGGGGGGFDPVADKAFGGSFGELYGRPDQGSAMLKDVLPTGRPNGGGAVPPRPPMFRDFFQNMFGGFG